jgi:hypothetical protein
MNNVQRQPKGKESGGQFAKSRNPECADLCLDIPDYNNGESSYMKWYKNGGWHSVRVTDDGNGMKHYKFDNARFGGGWDVDYDSETFIATACGRSALVGVFSEAEAEAFRDSGRSNVLDVVQSVEPEAVLVRLRGGLSDDEWYFADRRQEDPLPSSMVSGWNVGQMRLTSGASVDELREDIAKERASHEQKAIERPDMANSVRENLLHLDGMELAASLGKNAAEQNTIGAYKSRGIAE